MNKGPLFESLRSIGKDIENKKISPVEITKYYLDRLHKLGPEYNSVVTITEQTAIAATMSIGNEYPAGSANGPGSLRTSLG